VAEGRIAVTFLRIATLAAPLALSAPVTSARLAAELVTYHEHRVDIAHRHETEESRLERLRWLADGIIAGCTAEPFDVKLGWTFNQCVALATTAAEWESGLMVEVESGALRGPAGELGPWQLHRFVSAVPNPKYRVTPEELAASVGLSAETAALAARLGVRTLGWHVHRCRLRGTDFVAPAELFAEYHRPSVNCTATLTKMNSDRARSYRALLARLERN
jgi:hypothetical protein